MTVRNVRSGEWTLWRDLRFEALADSPDAFVETLATARSRPEDSWIEYTGSAGTQVRQLLFAEENNMPVGMMAVIQSATEGSQVNLVSMWVKPVARGRGHARALVEAAIAWASGRGAKKLVLRVTETCGAAIRLYTGMGFSDTGERAPLRVGSDLRTQRMELRLRE
jgi:ribosomal protein S18 acetylase RimI-like enzyme